MDRNEQYQRALDVLRDGGLVALPTDTVYGLTAVAADDAAIARLYEVKGRPPDQPLPLFVASLQQAELIAEVSETARRLAVTFWPGALTIVLRKKPAYRTLAAAGADTVGVRAPDDPVLRELAARLGPLTGTSANRSGLPEAHSAAEVRAQLGDAVDLIVDAPVAAGGVPSTVVDCTEAQRVRVLRQGAVARDAVAEVLAGVADVI